jgi:hypothetical protein
VNYAQAHGPYAQTHGFLNFKSMKTHYLKIIDPRIMDGFMVKNNGKPWKQPWLPFPIDPLTHQPCV